MNATDFIAALCIPDSARVDQRIPKKLLLENGAPTTTDKSLLKDAIEEIQWLGALKPNTIGVPEYRDATREYLEIALLSVTLRGNIKPARKSRLSELVHRAVPYPVLLLMIDGQVLTISVAHKRWAQNEVDKVVLDGSVVNVSLAEDEAKDSYASDPMLTAEVNGTFVQSMGVTHLPQTSLYALYQGWIDRLQALQAARLTGSSYQAPLTREQAQVRQQALIDCEQLEAEINRLRLKAAKEKQLARQVELNLALKRVRAELAVARQNL